MEITAYLLNTILLTTIRVTYSEKSLWEVVDLKAVTFSQDTFEYYNTIRVQKSDDPPEEVTSLKKRANIKKNICRNILSSHYFKMSSQDWVDVDDKRIRAELQNNSRYRDIFESIFAETSQSGVYEYRNPYQERIYDFQVYGDPGNEYVFVCLARNRLTREIKKYLISQEYNVNLDPLGDPIAGRFIFEEDVNRQLQIRGMTEEAAVKFKFSQITHLVDMQYWRSRLYDRSSETPDRDPICRLSETNKIRLCSSLLAASDFRKMTFLPIPGYIRATCEKIDISLSSKFFLLLTVILGYVSPSEAISSAHETFHEWMIGCYVLTNTGAEKMYYVSRGNIRNSIYVHIESDVDSRDLLFYNYYYNVGVAGTDEVEDYSDEEGSLSAHQTSESDSEDNDSRALLLQDGVEDR